jgi:hypothetical protein
VLCYYCYYLDFLIRNHDVGSVESSLKLIKRSAKVSCSFLNIQHNLRLKNGMERNYNWINKPHWRHNFCLLIYVLNITFVRGLLFIF